MNSILPRQIILGSVAVLALTLLSGCGSSSDAGIFKSVDGGASYIQSNTLDVEGTLASAEILDLVNRPSQPQVIFGAVASQGVVMSNDAGQNWTSTSLNTGTARELVFHPQNDEILYAAYEQQVIISQDGGQTFETLYADPALITTIAINPNAPANLWIGTQTGQLLNSKNGGRSWSVATSFRRAVTDVLVSPINGAIVVATQGSGLHVSADQGVSFEERTPTSTNTPGLSERQDSALVLAQSEQSNSPLFAATTKGLFMTSDLGRNWTIVNDPLSSADVPVTDLLVVPQNSSQIFILAGNNIAKSDDGGKSWFTRAVASERLAKTIVIIDPSNFLVGVAGEGTSFVERVI